MRERESERERGRERERERRERERGKRIIVQFLFRFLSVILYAHVKDRNLNERKGDNERVRERE